MAIIVSMIIMTVIEDAGVGVATGDPDCAPPEAESLRRRDNSTNHGRRIDFMNL